MGRNLGLCLGGHSQHPSSRLAQGCQSLRFGLFSLHPGPLGMPWALGPPIDPLPPFATSMLRKASLAAEKSNPCHSRRLAMPQCPHSYQRTYPLSFRQPVLSGRLQGSEQDRPWLSSSFRAVFPLESDGVFPESHTWLPYNAHSIHCFDGNITNLFYESQWYLHPRIQ